jgi:ribonucleoside-diphosphate reductase alpha chain
MPNLDLSPSVSLLLPELSDDASYQPLDVVGQQAGVGEDFDFPNLLSEFIYMRTYSRWLHGESRRETWEETVDRYLDFITAHRKIPTHIIRACREAILHMGILPSMRALWSAGPAALRDNTCFYNCSFIPLDSLKSFSELLYILMCGTGIGFSVERQFVDNLPVVASPSLEAAHYQIGDSTEGWADALFFGLTNWFQGREVIFDYSLIREAGAILKMKGGRASGPDPLRRLMVFCEETILGAAGRKLRPIECHDIACYIGEIVMVGGFRRAALISISDPDDEEMRHAKDWSRGSFPEVRYMANNSSYWEERPDAATFWKEWSALVASKSGERGFSIDSWHQRANRPKGQVRPNPCGEIGLKFSRSTDPWTGEGGGGQFCNLSCAVMRPEDTRETFAVKVRLATWLGAIQASFTRFPYLRPAWTKHCEEDRLLGVDITGQCDNPTLSNDVEAMSYFNQVAVDTAAEAAAYLDIAMPVAITCGKPSGNSSQLVDCASGFHPRYSRYYLRRVRIASHDPLFQLIRDAGVPLNKENGQENLPDNEVSVWVAEFPVKAPEHAVLRDHETALEQCERYLHIMRTWMGERGHNQSATIYVHEHEWQEVGQWVFDHFNQITGISFLPYDGGSYRLAPYEEITEEQFLVADAAMPRVDFALLSQYELEDRGSGGQVLACTGNACEIDYDKMAMEASEADAK